MANVAPFCASALCLFSIFSIQIAADDIRYEANWESLDKRPLPSWYDEAKFGIFLHWGVYSVPGFNNEWFWWNWQGVKNKNNQSYVDFMKKNYPPGFQYPDFAPMFKAEMFEPQKWVELFKSAGAKYVVLTSKHHEGFTLWPSASSWNWNAMDVGPHRDLVGDLAGAIRENSDLKFGLYHSLFEWFNPIYQQDRNSWWETNNFVQWKTMPELYDIVDKYRPDIVWSDGDWEAPDTYWNSTQFLAWLYNDSPVKETVVTNDRWGVGVICRHGGFLTCSDGFNPGVLQKRKWENAMTMTSSWGYIRNIGVDNVAKIESLVHTLAKTVSCGGNMLLNVGPSPDGRITPVFEERLRQMGLWLDVNGEAIYSSVPWEHQNDTITNDVWYTSRQVEGKEEKDTIVYAIVLKWPETRLILGAASPSNETTVHLLGYPDSFDFETTPAGGLKVHVPAIPIDKMPCLWAWVFKLAKLDHHS